MITKSVHDFPFSFTYSKDHKGAPYTIDGIHYMNAGELAECIDKACKGFEPVKDANTSFELGSDIEDLHISVKSGKATLTTKKLGTSFDEILANYFKAVPSTSWDWVAVLDEKVFIYNMDRKSFEEFTREFASLQKDRPVIRYKVTSSKMLGWLEERAA